MKNQIFATITKNNHCETINVMCHNSNLKIDVVANMPNTISKKELRDKTLILACLSVIEPFCRSGEEFIIHLPFEFSLYENTIKEKNDNHLDNDLYTYLNLKWVKEKIEFKKADITFIENENVFFLNRSTIEVYKKEIADKYSLEVNKTLPYAIYERLRSECDYAWRCSECPEGQNGNCEAAIYENYLMIHNETNN